MREHDPSSQDRPRKNSTASFSQMASNLRHKNRNTNTNNDDGEKCTERRGSTASFSQMASNLRRGSRSTTITNNNNTNITNTSSHDRKNSNASISQITHNFEKQGFVSPTSDDFPSVPNHTNYSPSHTNHTRRKKSEGSLFSSRDKEADGGKALERLGICKETEIVVSETARGGGGGVGVSGGVGETGERVEGRERFGREGREERAVRSFRERVGLL